MKGGKLLAVLLTNLSFREWIQKENKLRKQLINLEKEEKELLQKRRSFTIEQFLDKFRTIEERSRRLLNEYDSIPEHVRPTGNLRFIVFMIIKEEFSGDYQAFADSVNCDVNDISDLTKAGIIELTLFKSICNYIGLEPDFYKQYLSPKDRELFEKADKACNKN